MFWHAVGGGLGVLLHWQTWVGMLVYGALVLIPMIAVGIAAQRDMRLGCAGMLLLPLAQVFASIVVLWMLLPIILGLANEALWSMPFQLAIHSPGWMLKVVAGLTFLAFLSSLVPVLGRSGTFTNFVVGSYAIALATRSFAAASGRESLSHLTYVPGFWTFLGFLIIGGLVSTVGGIGAAAVSVATDPRSAKSENVSPGPLTISAIGLMGLVPCFMYGAWLGLQIKAVAP